MKLFGIDVGHGNSLKDKLYWLVNGFMTNMGFVLWGGSPPPASAPTQTTVMNTNIPDYAQPYVMNMLNAAQAQVYNPSGTGFNAYTPYSNNPANYVAGFSPLQQQAQSSAANLQVPGAYNQAMGQTMGVNRQLGGLGQQMGMTGMNYANQATNPASVNAYMNPYIQASLAPQLQLANQQYGIAGQQEQSGATQAGAFGGSREALMNSLNAQNQMLAQNQLISQGYNTAFQNAQQAQQFGANLGLQGQQAQAQALASQMAGANQLAGLGGQELAAQQSILGTQAQQGAQQQTQQQNIINQAIQNYATAQQYPYMQLGVLNSMLRGLPMQQSTTSMYQAPPSLISQAAGLGTAGIGLAGMANATGILKAKGGVIKAKEGGVMKAAGGIPMSMFSPEQLNAVEQSQYASPLAKLVASGYQQEDQRLQNNPIAVKAALSPPTPIPQRTGVDQIATPPSMTKMAGGGLLAFAAGDVTPLVDDTTNFKLSDQQSYDLTHPSSKNVDSPELKIFGQKVDPELRLFGYPMNEAAKKADKESEANMVPLNNSIVGNEANRMFDLSRFNSTKPVASATDTPGTYENFIKENTPKAPVVGSQNALVKTVNPNVVKEANPVAEAAPSEYDDLKKELFAQWKNPSSKTSEDIKEQLASVNKRIAEREAIAPYESLARAGFGIMAGTSPYALVNIGAGAPSGLEAYEKSKAATAEDQNLIDKYTIAGQQADEARHQQVGLNLLKIGEMEQAKKNELATKLLAMQEAQSRFAESQATKNILAGFKVDSARADKASQVNTALNTYDSALKEIERIRNHPGRFNGASLGNIQSKVPFFSSDAKDFSMGLEGVRNAQFMSGVQNLKGSNIGRILASEVPKIQGSTGILDTKLSREEMDRQFDRVEAQIKQSKERAIRTGYHYGLTPEDMGIQQ